jgi:hypothetical protein
MVPIDSTECPVCGCNPRLRRVRNIATWIALIGIVGWSLEHWALPRIRAASHGAPSDTHQAH